MFSGIGGFELGIERATNRESRRCEREARPNGGQSLFNGRVKPSTCSTEGEQQPWECIGYSEIDKYAIQIYERHFKHKNYGNARDIVQLPDFDLLVGGFPCQSFSIAGKRQGFNDTRGTLFFEIARILQIKKPKWVLLENVKGLLSHDNFRTITEIFRVLSELGYTVSWEVLNSKHFSVPQNRERIFIFGFRDGCKREVFPIGENDNAYNDGSRGAEPETKLAVAITTKEGGRKENNFISIPTNTKLGYDIAEEKEDGIRLQFENSKTARGRVVKGASQALQTSGQVGILENSKIRRLTPVECERLQGFPDGWTEGISDTQRYKCLGNAVTVNVIEAIFKKII